MNMHGADADGQATRRRFLPMLGHTTGKRSAVTCELKCANACFHPVPNTSENEYFRDIAGLRALATRIPRRARSPAGASSSARRRRRRAARRGGRRRPGEGRLAVRADRARRRRPFDAVRRARPATGGRRSSAGATRCSPRRDAFDPAAQTAALQERQFGYNNDYLDIIVGPSGRAAVLVANQEYTNENIMFPPAATPEELDEQRRVAMAAHGMAVVELSRSAKAQPVDLRRRRPAAIAGSRHPPRSPSADPPPAPTC